MLTKEQIRAARAYLDWNRETLSHQSGVTITQISNIETGETESPRQRTLQDIERAFLRAGVMFKEGGVLPRKPEIEILRGQKGFWEFYDDVYRTVSTHGGEILISGVIEKDFAPWLGDKRQLHKERMAQLKNFTQKIIVQEGAQLVEAAYSTTAYRTLTPEFFPDAPFYIYGGKVGIIDFEQDSVEIFIIDVPKVVAAHRKNFLALWALSKELAG